MYGAVDADRLFLSIVDTWTSVTSLPSDVKELIPEFYSTDPSFLLNLGNVDFGNRANGENRVIHTERTHPRLKFLHWQLKT